MMWYVDQKKTVTGPFTTEQVAAQLEAGTILPEATFCLQGQTTWRALGDALPELAAKLPKTPRALPVASACATTSSCGTGRCCPMPRIASALLTVGVGGYWAYLTSAMNGPVALWNCVWIFAYVVFGAALLSRSRHAYRWAVSSHQISVVWTGVQLAAFGTQQLVPVIVLNVLGLLALRCARKQYS